MGHANNDLCLYSPNQDTDGVGNPLTYSIYEYLKDCLHRLWDGFDLPDRSNLFLLGSETEIIQAAHMGGEDNLTHNERG